MTRSKVELATILVKLRGTNEDPSQLAKEMSLMKLCYEIQKVEEEAEKKQLEELSNKQKEVVSEIKTKKKKHLLSWLLDSSDDEA